VSVAEEVSRKTRDARQELRKYMRDVRRNSPEKFCKMQYDKLVVEDRVFVFSEEEGRVVEEIPRGRPSVDLWSENKELSETVEDLRRIISRQSSVLGHQSLEMEEHRCPGRHKEAEPDTGDADREEK